MAQVQITDLFIIERVHQSTYQDIVEQAAIAKGWELLSTTLANVTNRADEKRRDYCRRITTSGVPNRRFFTWTVFTKLKNAGTTVDDADILERQPDGTTPGFDKLKTGSSFAIDDFSGIVAGDDTAPTVNTDAQDMIFGNGAPTINAEFKGQEYLDQTAGSWYKAIATGTGSADWQKL